MRHSSLKSKQDWSVGNKVKVGFMELTVTDIITTTKPTTYLLVNVKGKNMNSRPTWEYKPYNAETGATPSLGMVYPA